MRLDQMPIPAMTHVQSGSAKQRESYERTLPTRVCIHHAGETALLAETSMRLYIEEARAGSAFLTYTFLLRMRDACVPLHQIVVFSRERVSVAASSKTGRDFQNMHAGRRYLRAAPTADSRLQRDKLTIQQGIDFDARHVDLIRRAVDEHQRGQFMWAEHNEFLDLLVERLV
jgi:hypothetical protein